MLLQLSIHPIEGKEVVIVETNYFKQFKIDSQLLSGFTHALQSISESKTLSIEHVGLTDLVIYLKKYEDFTIRALLQKKVSQSKAERLFAELSLKIMKLTDNSLNGVFPGKIELKKALMPLIEPLIKDSRPGVDVDDLQVEESLSRITLAGLAGAGKTSIKKMFFENWTKKRVKNLRPTIGMNMSSKFLEIVSEKFVIMDCGGQKSFLPQHLSREEIWKDISVLIFVVDIQNSDYFESAREYLSQIWEVVTRVNDQNPRLTIFIHKFDILVRKNLGENIKQFLIFFKEFIDIAAFHLTTIEDTSSSIAMIKTLYLSTPDVIIRKLFEERFLDHFETEVIPQFAQIISNGRLQDSFKNMKESIRENAVHLGTSFCLSLQESWLKYLMGEWKPVEREPLEKKTKVGQKGSLIYLKIPNWVEKGIPSELTDLLIDGMLEGIFGVLHLEIPEMIEQRDSYSIWRSIIGI